MPAQGYRPRAVGQPLALWAGMRPCCARGHLSHPTLKRSFRLGSAQLPPRLCRATPHAA